jgi:Fe-S-cluster containining protein
METEADILAIPAAFVGKRGMRCVGNRCSALDGDVGVQTSCTVYAVRPEVCRSCMPGDAFPRSSVFGRHYRAEPGQART